MTVTYVKDWVVMVLGSGGLLGLAYLVFRSGRLVQKMEDVGKNVDKIMTNHLPHIQQGLDEISKALNTHINQHK